MNLEDANETDIREEIAAPLLKLLGYERNTQNDIRREYPLKYDREFLGRKKPTDPPLRGKVDYMLSVVGSGRWVLEVKALNVSLDSDAVDQAISYARHPEVSGKYAALLNGKEFKLFHNTQNSSDRPIIHIPISSVEDLANKLHATLSPPAIRRDFTPPIVDIGTPLAEGLRSRADITGGFIMHSHCECSSNMPIPGVDNAFDETCRRLIGFRSTITGGKIWRDEQSRIRAKLNWAVPNDAMLKFMEDKALQEFEYLSLAAQISDSAEAPTIFDVVGAVNIYQDEQIFDMIRWETKQAGIDMSMIHKGQASGYIRESAFVGHYQANYEMRFPLIPGLITTMNTSGEFEVHINLR